MLGGARAAHVARFGGLLLLLLLLLFTVDAEWERGRAVSETVGWATTEKLNAERWRGRAGEVGGGWWVWWAVEQCGQPERQQQQQKPGRPPRRGGGGKGEHAL